MCAIMHLSTLPQVQKMNEDTITYAHKDAPNGTRFRALAKDPVPVWAVDVQPEPNEHTFHGTCGSYSVGDTVRAFGYEGTWTVLGFAGDYRSSSQGETGAVMIHNETKRRLFYPAHLVKKA